MLSQIAAASALVGAALATDGSAAAPANPAGAAAPAAAAAGWGAGGYGAGWGGAGAGTAWGGGAGPWFAPGAPGYIPGVGYAPGYPGYAGSAALWAAPAACTNVCQPVINLGVQCGFPGQVGNAGALNCVCQSNTFNVRNIGGLCNSCLTQQNWNIPIMQQLATTCNFDTVNYTPTWNTVTVSKRAESPADNGTADGGAEAPAQAPAPAPGDSGVQMKWGGGGGGWGGNWGSGGGGGGGGAAAAPQQQQAGPVFWNAASTTAGPSGFRGALFGLAAALGLAYALF